MIYFNSKIMNHLPVILVKTGLVTFESNAELLKLPKNHVSTLHEVHHYILWMSLKSIFVYAVEMDVHIFNYLKLVDLTVARNKSFTRDGLEVTPSLSA